MATKVRKKIKIEDDAVTVTKKKKKKKEDHYSVKGRKKQLKDVKKTRQEIMKELGL